MRSAMIVSVFALAACTTVPAESGEAVAATCKNEALSSFVGRDANEQTGADLLKQSGANVLRWVPKGMMVTMDFRADRVTAYLDGSNKIERVSCG